MASSRWKRFAFFERQTLNITDVLEDLMDQPDSSPEQSKSLRSLAAAATSSAEALSFVASTAGLPPSSTATIPSDPVLLSSLNACINPTLATTTSMVTDDTVPLPTNGVSSQHRNGNSSSDGLVLAFIGSKDCPRVHCLDLTRRCHALSDDAADGWRGYVSLTTNGVVDLAVCRYETRNSSRHSTSFQQQHRPLLLACLHATSLTVYQDPHIGLSAKKPFAQEEPTTSNANAVSIPAEDGTHPVAVDISISGKVAIGTKEGIVHVYQIVYSRNNTPTLKPFVRIPPPPSTTSAAVVSLRWSSDDDGTASNGDAAPTPQQPHLFVAYAEGLCCYHLPATTPTVMTTGTSSGSGWAAPTGRHDLDGRALGSPSLVDRQDPQQVAVARADGLYSYSFTERTNVAPIDGAKLALCVLPPAEPAKRVRDTVGPSTFALVASTDSKSGRDTVDIYDATNKLVAFHLLLSPGHRAVRAAGVTAPPAVRADGSGRSGRSCATVITSGGSLYTFTEKLTNEKIALLVQKHLYSAAIVVAYADPSYEASDITSLYQQYAEHLYRKGDYSGAIDQYIHTIGSLESSHVIFRYLDAPKIPLLVKYLEKLRSRELATPVHKELLRTCYLKLNDMKSAEGINVSTSQSITDASLDSILSNLTNKPKDALATICSLEAPQAAEVLVVHGASLARILPRETAGVVIALCVGTYEPTALAATTNALATSRNATLDALANATSSAAVVLDKPYHVSLFASAFVEHPKLLRLILAHCNRNKCPLTPSLRRTLLELTLAEWNQAQRSGDTEVEKLRYKEAIASLTDSHARDIGDYDALVIVQQARFADGELLLYERLHMTPFLLERYAKDGTNKSRRQMLAMSQSDPHILADVLGLFVGMATQKLRQENARGTKILMDDMSDDDEMEEIMDDIQEVLQLARRQRALPPVRLARILAGEGTSQFSVDNEEDAGITNNQTAVPLSVALDYVGTVLEESRLEAVRLKSEIEEYNQLCNSMELEIDSLLRSSCVLPPLEGDDAEGDRKGRLDIDELFTKVKLDDGHVGAIPEQAREAFWREMDQTDDNFGTIARFFSKGLIG